MVQTIKTLEKLIMGTAHETVFLQETDSASANERLWHHRLTVNGKDGVLKENIVCHSHQCNLVETAVVGTTHERLVSDFFSFTHFLQASSHFNKLKLAVQAHIKEKAVIEVGLGGAAGLLAEHHAQFTDELLSMQLQVYNYVVQGSDTPKDDDDTELTLYQRKIQDFKQMWNCDLSNRSDDFFRHYCVRSGRQDTWCCQSDEEAVEKMAGSLIKVAMGRVPETPSPGKWTKLWSCLMFVVPQLNYSLYIFCFLH